MILNKPLLICMLILLLAINFSFSQDKKSANKTQNQAHFDYNNFPIKKGKLGEIKIGMTISEAEKKFDRLRKENNTAGNFGYDGGGVAFVYFEKEKPVFAFIPKFENDTILAIIAMSEKLKTSNGLHPNSSVKEILKIYPDIQVNLDMLNGKEYIFEAKNQLTFYFSTDPENSIGDYDFEKYQFSSAPKRLNFKADWITIK